MNQNQNKTCDKKLKSAQIKLHKIVNKLNSFKLSESNVSRIHVFKRRRGFFEKYMEEKSKMLSRTSRAVSLVSAILVVWWLRQQSTKGCFLDIPSASKTLFRPPEECSMCAGIDRPVRLANVTGREFEKRYAYGTVPVIVTDATADWKAIEHFNFEFFVHFYRTLKMGRKINDCFYFAYESGLNSLDEVFNMDRARANLTAAPWYVGWSTCYEEEARQLRQYYTRPYFLPPTSESDTVDWIFMGGPGRGAHMHVDSVRHVSWQAQVRGRKRWELAPPPECLYRCSWMSFTVQPGEILVVDTNRWYHQTHVLPGDISITIGAEYD